MISIDHVNFYRGVHADIYERMFERRTEGARSELTLVAALSRGADMRHRAVATSTHARRMSTRFVDKPIEAAGGAPV